MAYEYIAVVASTKVRVTWATSWGRLQRLIDFIRNWKTSAEYNRWVVETQLCKLVIRQTRSLGVLVLFSICNIMVVVNYIYDMVVDTQFHKFYGRPFVCVLYLFRMKDIGRWLPWMLPGSTGRFYKDDVAHNHSAHGYYITPIDREEFDSMIRLHVKQNKTKLLRKKLQVRGTPCKCCSRSQQRSSPGLRLRLTALLVLIECVWWNNILSSLLLLLIFLKYVYAKTWQKKSCKKALRINLLQEKYM